MVQAETVVRVGGQALPDGVLMRTSRAWAIARADGSVVSGVMPRARFDRIPVLRVLAGLGPAIALGLAGGRRTDAFRRPQPRKPPWTLIWGVVVAEAAVMGVGRIAVAARLPSQCGPAVSLGLMGIAIVVFRAATPSRQWRYHGAEHKAVAAHERRVDLANIDHVLSCSRVHPRCGTNLIVWMAIAAVWLGRLPLIAQIPAVALSLACVAEVVTVAGRRPKATLARLVLAPGQFLQRYLTTSEPDPADQRVACHALKVCLELERRLAPTTPAMQAC